MRLPAQLNSIHLVLRVEKMDLACPRSKLHDKIVDSDVQSYIYRILNYEQ